MKFYTARIFTSGCLLATVVLPLTVLAQTDKLQLELGKCSLISDINARVSCYDNLARPFAALQQNNNAANTSQAPAVKVAVPVPGVKAAEPAVTAKAAAPAARAEAEASKIEKFGQQQAKIEAATNGDEVLVGKVAALKEVVTNKLQITLANGQVWQQTISKPFFLHENDTVRISPSSWGNSFHLEKDGKPGFIQVSRLH